MVSDSGTWVQWLLQGTAEGDVLGMCYVHRCALGRVCSGRLPSSARQS